MDRPPRARGLTSAIAEGRCENWRALRIRFLFHSHGAELEREPPEVFDRYLIGLSSTGTVRWWITSTSIRIISASRTVKSARLTPSKARPLVRCV